MSIQKTIPLIEEILGAYREQIGVDYQGYKNHVYRMVHFCFWLCEQDEGVILDDDNRQKILTAACFHDLGIWPEGTVDYLPPSIALLDHYLEQKGLQDWSEEITLMIDLHHKLRKVRNLKYPLVELFRRADMVDFLLGTVKWGVPENYIREVKAAFPNAGFHKRLGQLAWKQLLKHPLNPAPMMKW